MDYNITILPDRQIGIFKSRGPLIGRDWVARLNPEDREVFSWLGRRAGDFGRMGGKARARTAKRDKRGRFASNE